MTRIAFVVLTLTLSACVLEEATEADIAEVESESATTGPTITALTDDQVVTISGAPNTIKYFKLEVPAGMDHVAVFRQTYALYAGASLYLRRGALPTQASYDCAALDGVAKQCTVHYPVAGTYYIMVLGTGTYGYTNLPMWADSWNTYHPIGNNTSLPIWNQYGYDLFYKLSVPDNAGSVSFTFTLDPDDDGRVDLVVKRGRFATATAYDCKKYIDWNLWTMSATCSFSNPTPGTYYVGLLGHGSKYVGTFSARWKWALVTDAPTSSTLD